LLSDWQHVHSSPFSSPLPIFFGALLAGFPVIAGSFALFWVGVTSVPAQCARFQISRIAHSGLGGNFFNKNSVIKRFQRRCVVVSARFALHWFRELRGAGVPAILFLSLLAPNRVDLSQFWRSAELDLFSRQHGFFILCLR